MFSSKQEQIKASAANAKMAVSEKKSQKRGRKFFIEELNKTIKKNTDETMLEMTETIKKELLEGGVPESELPTALREIRLKVNAQFAIKANEALRNLLKP